MNMKKLFLMAAVAGLVFASCSDESLVDPSISTAELPEIGFNVTTQNSTRAAAQASGHYEFGVFANTGETDNDIVMDNYLVGYGNNTNFTSGTTPYLYYTLDSSNPTWGNATPNAETTDSRDGYSSWFYKGLDGSSANTGKTKADHTQVLKFWDYSKANTYFYAYTPYGTTKTTAQITFNKSAKTIKYTKLSAFYTDPVLKASKTTYELDNCYQVESYYKGTAEDEGVKSNVTYYNNEVLNYNEATYAYTSKAKATAGQYGSDVALSFNHLNAKIKLQFTLAGSLTGYNVRILDLVPAAAEQGSNKFALKKTPGIVLTPSTQQQASTPMTVTQPADDALPTYVQNAGLTTTAVTTTVTAPTLDDINAVNTNLYFKAQATDATAATTYEPATCLYVLPNVNSSSEYLSGFSTDYQKTGYTLHVTYELVAGDGSQPVRVYDARVWIPADACKWAAGKQYTYVIKITGASTGTTDPQNAVDPATSGGTEEAYVDGRDPRVPTDAALTPIVFDGVTVTDYTTETVTPADEEVSSYEFKTEDAGTKYFVTASTITSSMISDYGTAVDPKTVFVTTANKDIEASDPARTATGAWSFVSTSGKEYFKFTATADPKHEATFAATVEGTNAYAYIWNEDATSAYKILVTQAGDPAAWGTPDFETYDDNSVTKFKTYTPTKAYLLYQEGSDAPAKNFTVSPVTFD